MSITFPVVSVTCWHLHTYQTCCTHFHINFLYLKHTVMQVHRTLRSHRDRIKKILQWDVDKKGPSKVPAVPDPYLPGSCIAGVCLELLDVLASGTLISAKRGKTEKGLIYTIETKASNSWKSGTGRGRCPSRDGRDRAEQFGNEERQ